MKENENLPTYCLLNIIYV